MRLHHVRRGSGSEPLLLIQGMSGHAGHWGEPFLSLLDEHFDVIAVDHRNTGGSPRVEGAFTLVDLAEDIAGQFGDLGLENAHVLGISMGGMVAQELALRHPDRVRRLVIGCSYAGGPGSALSPPEVQRSLMEGMASGDVNVARQAMWRANVSAAYAADPDHFAQFERAAQDRPVPAPVIMRQMQAIAQHDTSARLGQITAPTLVIHGTEDQMLPASNGEMIAAAIPGARLELLEGVGHMFWVEQPERSARLVTEHCLAAAAG